MIRVVLAPEPPDFDAKVRRRGLAALAELVGETSGRKRPGPVRAKVADTREELSPEAFPPYWRDALPDLLRAYRRICAYSSLYIERVTGADSVDHVRPKSRHWAEAYEWRNYRLACAQMNTLKGVADDVLDPVEVEDHWFALDRVGWQVMPARGLPDDVARRVIATIARLGLNEEDLLAQRGEYAEAYLERAISFAWLATRAPFVARELARQGLVHVADVTAASG